MNIATFSPALVLLYVVALLWILMDVQFHRLTRTQKWLVPLIVLVLAVGNHFLRTTLGSAVYGKFLLFTMHLPVFLLFKQITNCSGIKMAFMIMTAVVFMAPPIIVGNIVKRVFFPLSSLALFCTNLLTYAVLILLIQMVFRKGFNNLLKYGDNRFFLRFSLVPLLYYVYLFAVMNLDLSSLYSTRGFIVRILPTVYVFLFYFLLLHNHQELNERRELETAQAALSRQLDAATEQIAFLNESQVQTAIYRHNLRHHLAAIDGFLSTDRPEQAREYIKKVGSDVEAITPKQFCENELVNLLCSSFSDKAERAGARLTVKASLPRTLSVTDTELCSILSNGLENALRAIESLPSSDKWMELYCDIRMNKLLIEIRNPYDGEVLLRDGLPISSREGHGYGCQSIRTISEQHKGLCAFEPKGGVFTLRVLLPVQAESQ